MGICDGDGDSDGVADHLDTCPRLPNNDQADHDGVGDLCPADFDPDQADHNCNGLGDACEPIDTSPPIDTSGGSETALEDTYVPPQDTQATGLPHDSDVPLETDDCGLDTQPKPGCACNQRGTQPAAWMLLLLWARRRRRNER
jgi:hypothetical protein